MDRKRINKIIEIKENIKKDKEREIEEANIKMASICREIESIEGVISQNHAKLYSTALSGNDFAVLTDYLDYLDTSRSAYICDKNSLQENIDVLYQELYEYTRELKMLCKLRDKVMTAFRKGELRREQKMLDALALRLGHTKI